MAAAFVGFVCAGFLILMMSVNAGINDRVRRGEPVIPLFDRDHSSQGRDSLLDDPLWDDVGELGDEVAALASGASADDIRALQESQRRTRQFRRSPHATAERMRIEEPRHTAERPRAEFICFHVQTGAYVGATSRESTVVDAERKVTVALREMGTFRSSDRAKCRPLDRESYSPFGGVLTTEEHAAIQRAYEDAQRAYQQHAAQHRHVEHRPDYSGTFYCAIEGEYVGTAPGASNAAETASRVRSRLRERGQPVAYPDIECCGSYRSEADYLRDHPEVHQE